MRLHLDDARLAIVFEGWERLWSLRNRVVIPRSCITDITIYEPSVKMQFRKDLLKIAPVSKRMSPGVHITPWSKDFWYVRPGKQYAEILTKDHEFGRIVISPPPGDIDMLDHEFNKRPHAISRMLSSDLESLKNLGPRSIHWLRSVGITTKDQLKQANYEDIYIKLKLAGYPVNKQFLYSIEGALTNMNWQDIKEERKRALAQIAARVERDVGI